MIITFFGLGEVQGLHGGPQKEARSTSGLPKCDMCPFEVIRPEGPIGAASFAVKGWTVVVSWRASWRFWSVCSGVGWRAKDFTACALASPRGSCMVVTKRLPLSLPLSQPNVFAVPLSHMLVGLFGIVPSFAPAFAITITAAAAVSAGVGAFAACCRSAASLVLVARFRL